MQIEPMITRSFFTEPRLRDVGQPDLNERDDSRSDPLAAQAMQPADMLAALQSQFSTLFKELSKEFAALERRLSQAISQLAKNAESTDGSRATPPSKGHAPQRQRYGAEINAAAQRNEIDPALLDSVINQESGFNPRARSQAGAMGLMQLMPDTARALGVKDPYDPGQNVEGGAHLLRQLLDRYHGKLDLALAAYNAGAEAVDKYGGVPPYAETQNYVRNILAGYGTSALRATPPLTV